MSTDTADLEVGPHDDEPHDESLAARLNWLRAGVLGANDGIVSTAGLVVGVAGATTDRRAILVAGVAGLVAGAMSMAAGEYVSVSTQRDSEQALLAKERRELREEPEEELAELAGLYVQKGLAEDLALQVAEQLTEHDALGAHAEAELGIDPDDLTNPWHAALASMSPSPSARCSRCSRSCLPAAACAGAGHRGRRCAGRSPSPAGSAPGSATARRPRRRAQRAAAASSRWW